MVAAGVVDDVDWFFGAHVGVTAKTGHIQLCADGYLATTKFDVNFTGIQSHACLLYTSRLSGRDLNSRRLAEEVRDRVENTDDEGKQDDEVFPNGITIHLDYPKPGLISRA